MNAIKKIVIGAALAALYSALCYMQRGYFNWRSDLLVIAMATVCYICASGALKSDKEEIERRRAQRIYPEVEKYEREADEWLVK